MGSIKFNKQTGRRKRTLPGKDHYTGYIVYNDVLPAGFDDVQDVITAETKATAAKTIAAIGNDGNTTLVFVQENGGIVMLCEYIKIAGDNTATKVATAIAAAINAGTSGYTAVSAGAVITVTARPGLGITVNGKALQHASTDGSLNANTNNFAGGVNVVYGTEPSGRVKLIRDIDAAVEAGITAANADAGIKRMHYHIDELFRLNPDAVLYVGVFAVPVGAHTFNEIETVRRFANNELRQIGVFTPKAYANGDIALLQDMYDDAFELMAPFEILYSPNLAAVSAANMPDLSAKSAPNVHLLIAQDGAARGATLFAATPAVSVGVIGAALGALSRARVHINFGWVEQFNMAQDGGELDVLALANGVLIETLSNALVKDMGTFDTKRLIFLKKYPNTTGSYFNDTHGACAASSDYAYIEDNRTIDKAIREVYRAMLPKVNGPTLLQKGTSKLDPSAVSVLELAGKVALETMEKDGELSGYTVSVDPEQDVTEKIDVEIVNTAVGVSRRFNINIGF